MPDEPNPQPPPDWEMTEHGQFVPPAPLYSAALLSDKPSWPQTPRAPVEWDEHDSI
jgi:hypothetical protein